jgi:hypothetical protein
MIVVLGVALAEVMRWVWCSCSVIDGEGRCRQCIVNLYILAITYFDRSRSLQRTWDNQRLAEIPIGLDNLHEKANSIQSAKFLPPTLYELKST